MKYSTVIFDLDGTLLDTSKGIITCARYTADKMGFPDLTNNQQRNFIGPPILDSFMREYGISESKARDVVEIYRKRYKEIGLYEASHYDRVIGLLTILKDNKCKLAVATLKRDDFAKEILRHYELSGFFNFIKGIDAKDTLSKSDILLMCLKELEQTDLSKVILIGDSIYDSIGAEQIGIDFLAVTYGYGFRNKNDANKSRNVFIAENADDILNYFNLL
ncbi:HAD hydrolase-like protein [Bacillus sp. JJ1566]|uniref:HAD hydrolase-like protein n=1 Tax=Bacillus sp. JJ1566 TaxID=3122961 RepID=UPI002FFF9CB3